MNSYDTGLVCENGHAINGHRQDSPEFNKKFCSRCGAKAIKSCPSCNNDIEGKYRSSVIVIGGPGWSAPPYCHECGAAYPWTAKKAEALQEAIDELDDLREEERDRLKASVPDVVANTPNSETAVLRFKKAIGKVSEGTANILRSVVTSVATEAVKKSMGL